MISKKKRPTIKDIAELSGVSIGTVDRALHGRKEINPQTKEKVLKVAKNLGYETNYIASALSRKKPLVLAAIFPRELHYFYDDVRRGFLDALEQLKNFKVIPLFKDVGALGKGEEKEALEELFEEEVDGVIFVPGHRSRFNALIDRFAERNIPVVTVSTDAPRSKRLTAVYVDPCKNGELAGELMSHFVPEGSTVVAMVGSLDIEDHFRKMEGFQKSLKESFQKIRLGEIVENQEDEKLARENCCRILQKYPDVRGIYIATANSVAVCEVLEGCFPHRVKVIATDLFQEMIPYLVKGVIHATIFQNPYRQGFEATMFLFHFLAKGVVPPFHSYLEPIVVMKSNLDFYFRRRESK
ncbi:MAG: LacI family DNA-binding transcriptional regulator [Candidatus Caldatribacteriaceae bacterium]